MTNNWDYIGPLRRRFRLLKFRFDYGRLHYESDAWGKTIRCKFIWEQS